MDSIVTVGISPCWDLTCKADGLDWGMHEKLSSQQKKCAGKAFNISRAMAWLGTPFRTLDSYRRSRAKIEVAPTQIEYFPSTLASRP